jgi:hypothetical protein
MNSGILICLRGFKISDLKGEHFMWNRAKCIKCDTEIKIGWEWGFPYYYCPKCREDRSEKGGLK